MNNRKLTRIDVAEIDSNWTDDTPTGDSLVSELESTEATQMWIDFHAELAALTGE